MKYGDVKFERKEAQGQINYKQHKEKRRDIRSEVGHIFLSGEKGFVEIISIALQGILGIISSLCVAVFPDIQTLWFLSFLIYKAAYSLQNEKQLCAF